MTLHDTIFKNTPGLSVSCGLILLCITTGAKAETGLRARLDAVNLLTAQQVHAYWEIHDETDHDYSIPQRCAQWSTPQHFARYCMKVNLRENAQPARIQKLRIQPQAESAYRLEILYNSQASQTTPRSTCLQLDWNGWYNRGECFLIQNNEGRTFVAQDAQSLLPEDSSHWELAMETQRFYPEGNSYRRGLLDAQSWQTDLITQRLTGCRTDAQNFEWVLHNLVVHSSIERKEQWAAIVTVHDACPPPSGTANAMFYYVLFRDGPFVHYQLVLENIEDGLAYESWAPGILTPLKKNASGFRLLWTELLLRSHSRSMPDEDTAIEDNSIDAQGFILAYSRAKGLHIVPTRWHVLHIELTGDVSDYLAQQKFDKQWQKKQHFITHHSPGNLGISCPDQNHVRIQRVADARVVHDFATLGLHSIP